MQIKINGGGLLTGATIGDYQTDLSGYISKSNDIISSFKTVKSQTCSLNGGVSSYTSNAMNDIDHRLAEEEKKREATITIQNKSNDFLTLAQRVDNEVAKDVNKNKDEFYKTTKFSKPAVQPLEKRWYEKAADWLDWFFSPAKTKKDREKKAKIYKWIIAGVGIAASVALTALVPGAGVVGLMIIGGLVGAGSAGANNLVDQYVEKGNLIENWDKIEWGSFIKASAIGAITGAVSSFFGFHASNGLNTLLRSWGSSFLTSSNFLIRIGSASLIGGTTHVAAGFLTRGISSAIVGALTGEFSWKNVFSDMFNPTQILIDFSIGSVSQGLIETKQYKADMKCRDFNETNQPVQKAKEKGFNLKEGTNKTLDYKDSDCILKNDKGEQIIVKEKMTGSRSKDFSNAFKTAEEQYGVSKADLINKYGKGSLTWQHMDDYNVRTGKCTLQLVLSKAHAPFKHAGSCSQYSYVNGVKYK